MEVEKIKQLLRILGQFEMSRTEFLIEFNDYIKNLDGSDVTFNQWLCDVHGMSLVLKNLTETLMNEFDKDNLREWNNGLLYIIICG